MKQTTLTQVQIRLDQLKDVKQQMEDTQKNIVEKEHEISTFIQEWKNNCKHVFYRVQRISIVPYTVGYHCCLCGTFKELQPSNNFQPSCSPTSYSPTYSSLKLRYSSRPHFPTPPKESQEFIGTVIQTTYASKEKEEELFPIPPKYQVQVDSKLKQLDKLKAEKVILAENLANLEATAKSIEQELNKIAKLLMNYFDYPQIVERAPFHWSPDDFNYAPFD